MDLPVVAPDDPPKIRGHQRPVRIAHEQLWANLVPAVIGVTKMLRVRHGLYEVVLIDVVPVSVIFLLLCLFPEIPVIEGLELYLLLPVK